MRRVWINVREGHKQLGRNRITSDQERWEGVTEGRKREGK